MIVTEEEAKTKRCQEGFPAALLQTPTGAMQSVSVGMLTSFPSAVHTAPTHCIGSACMGWCWSGWRDGENHIFTDEYDHGSGPTERVGYCGKAGPGYP